MGYLYPFTCTALGLYGRIKIGLLCIENFDMLPEIGRRTLRSRSHLEHCLKLTNSANIEQDWWYVKLEIRALIITNWTM